MSIPRQLLPLASSSCLPADPLLRPGGIDRYAQRPHQPECRPPERPCAHSDSDTSSRYVSRAGFQRRLDKHRKSTSMLERAVRRCRSGRRQERTISRAPRERRPRGLRHAGSSGFAHLPTVPAGGSRPGTQLERIPAAGQAAPTPDDRLSRPKAVSMADSQEWSFRCFSSTTMRSFAEASVRFSS